MVNRTSIDKYKRQHGQDGQKDIFLCCITMTEKCCSKSPYTKFLSLCLQAKFPNPPFTPCSTYPMTLTGPQTSKFQGCLKVHGHTNNK